MRQGNLSEGIIAPFLTYLRRTAFGQAVVAGVLIGCLAGCAEVQVFEDSRREAGQRAPIGQSAPDAPAICYHPWWHEQETVQALADEICAKTNRRAVLHHTASFSCRFMTPTTAFYTCVPKSQQKGKKR